MPQQRSSSRGDFSPLRGRVWPLQDAKARFSKLFRQVRTQGPQRVTRHGKESVIVLRAEEYEELLRHHTGPRSLVDFFAQSPLAGAGLALKRDPDGGRDIHL